jgi:hypothetical protein
MWGEYGRAERAAGVFDVVYICPSINVWWRLRRGGVARAEDEDEDEDAERRAKAGQGRSMSTAKHEASPPLLLSSAAFSPGRVQRPCF